MNLKQIEYIVAIAEEGGITRAAEKLYISQSALSQCLLNLEKELGVQLFKRVNKKLLLSYAGKNYIESAKKILDIKEQTYRFIGDISNSGKGAFTVGITPLRGLELFSDIYPQFHKTYPEVVIYLKESGAKHLEFLLRRGKVDIATISTQEYPKEINYELVDEEELFFVIPSSHPLAHLSGQGNISIDDLRFFENDNFLATNRHTALRAITDNLCQQAGIIPNIVFESSSASPIARLVQAGIGVGFVSAKKSQQMDGVIFLSLFPQQKRQLLAAYRKDSYLTKPERYYIELIKEYYR